MKHLLAPLLSVVLALTPLSFTAGATAFTSSSSVLSNTTATGLTQTIFTICAWTYALGAGGTNGGRIFSLGESGGERRPSLRHRGGGNADTVELNVQWTNVGLWRWTQTDNAWHSVCVSYDGGSTANDPVVRVDGSTVSTTEITTPSGTLTSASAGYAVGNSTGTANNEWNGYIAEVQYWSGALSTADMDTAVATPGSVTTNLLLYLPMHGAADVNDASGNGRHGTAASTSDAPSGPFYTFPNAIINALVRGGGWRRPSV